MATPSKGVGRGYGSGGARPGAGRPVGSIDRKARAVIAEAERDGLLMPIDFLLNCMRDTQLPLKDRVFCATSAAPYVHARRTVLRVMPEPGTMDDIELQVQMQRFEQRAALMNESERAESLDRDLQHLLEEVPRLSIERRETFFHKLISASENGLKQLDDEPDPPGTVIPRAARRQASEPVPAAAGDQWLDYDLATGKLRRPR